MFSAIWSGVKAVFGSEPNKAADLVGDTVRGVGSWIDEQQFTEQEKQEAKMKMVEHYADYLKNTMTENTERSRTRRNLAIWIIRSEIFVLIGSIIASAFSPDLSKYMYQVATDSPLGLLTLGVGAFFFGTHLIRSTPIGKS